MHGILLAPNFRQSDIQQHSLDRTVFALGNSSEQPLQPKRTQSCCLDSVQHVLSLWVRALLVIMGVAFGFEDALSFDNVLFHILQCGAGLGRTGHRVLVCYLPP